MSKDKFSAVWVSHSSIGDFLACPRAYYLKNVYKDPKTGHKIKLMAPPLALGQAVHEVLEGLSVLPKDERFNESLITKFHKEWEKFTGKKGGFWNAESEYTYKQRGEEMLRLVYNNPGILKNLSVKIQKDLPYYWISEEDNIILCGKVDWLEYLPEIDSVHILDFKTGKNEENGGSLQLPIYNLLVTNCQERPVVKVSYWYLDKDKEPVEQKLPDLETAHNQVLDIAKKIKLARKLEKFDCPKGDGCFACKPMERILRGEGEFIGLDQYGADMYILSSESDDDDKISSKIL